MKSKICIVYSHHKLGDLIWQLPYIEAISDHHKEKIDLIVRSKTQAKKILQDTNFIDSIFYNEFRKSFFYWVEVLKIFLLFKKNNYTHVYILDKINRPAIAAYLARTRNIIGLGIGNQKKWLTNTQHLTQVDKVFLDYSDQSKKFLKLNNIKISHYAPRLVIKSETLKNINFKTSILGQTSICLGVDSFEEFKIWKEENFSALADLMYMHKLANNFYLISDPSRKKYAKKIISLSKNKIFTDCSHLELLEVIKVIKNSKFYIGNNSGPLNLAAALGVRSFGLIAADSTDELKNSKIICITPESYNKNDFTRDKIVRDRKNMDQLSVDRVFSSILSHFRNA
jgi:heptosyltransferase II